MMGLSIPRPRRLGVLQPGDRLRAGGWADRSRSRDCSACACSSATELSHALGIWACCNRGTGCGLALR
jgi:hypothetical protein